MTWQVVTGEYPPRCGGVGDYCAQLAAALAATGDDVLVWAPDMAEGAPQPSGVHLHPLPDLFGPGSQRALESAWHKTPGPVLVQYVPNAFGRRGTNLAFCRWLRRASARGVDIRVMFHEPYLRFTITRPWRNVPAAVQRLMAVELLRAASRVYLSSEAWLSFLRPFGRLSRSTVLPIPSTIPTARTDDVAAFRRSFGTHGTGVAGHFGTYGDHVKTELRSIVRALLSHRPSTAIVWLGNNSAEFLRELARGGFDISRMRATGRLRDDEVAAAIAACDVMLQPYPDGVTTRRTSVMASLRNGVAVITTDGELTESIWCTSGGVALVDASAPAAFAAEACRLLDDEEARRALAGRGAALYDRAFSIERTVAALRGAPAPALS